MKPLAIAIAIVVIVALAAGCGGGKGNNHWAKRKVETVATTVGGVDFSIDVPTGMRMRAEADSVELDIHENERVYTPNLTIRVGHEETLDEYLKTESTKDFLRKEQLADGFVVSHENSNYPGKEDYIVYAGKKVGAAWLTCHGRVTRFVPKETVKDKVPQVEAMCLSMKAR